MSVAASAERAKHPETFQPGAIRVWAIAGAAWTLFALYGWTRWVFFSDDFAPMEQGPDDIPGVNLAFVYGYQFVAISTLMYMGLRFIVRPVRRDGRLPLDGMLLIAGTLAYFIDPMINFVHPDTFGWNAHAVDLGSWGSAFPWSQPNHSYGEALLWAWPDYIDFGLIGAIAGCSVLKALRRRHPRMSIVTAMAIFWLMFFVVASFVEIVRVRFELYSYARTISELTFWDGETYQWPIYEWIFTACAVTAFTYIRWSWITTGRSFLDSGLAELHVSDRARDAIRLLAVIAIVPVVWAAFYFLPWAMTSVFADSVADLPSYMTPVE